MAPQSPPNPPNPPACPECLGRLVNGFDCWQQLGFVLAWEYDDEELREEHFLTVASYNLQHPARFNDEAIAGLRLSVAEYLDGSIDVAVIRRRASRAAEGKRRVFVPESERRLQPRRWSRTIADVYLPDCPAGAAQRVREWARSIRNEW